MATITTDLICNLNQPVAATFLHGNLFSQDNAGNTINVHVMDNGEPATIGGTVSANVIRADGNTVAVSGSLSGNQCSVVLPQACYAVPGRVEIIIKLTQSTTITTIAAIVANVYRSTTDTVVDPGTIIQSIQALIEEIEDAVDSIPVDYSGLLATIAADYSSSKTYPVVGMYAWQGGVLKRNIVPITTAETYTAAHWTNVVIGDDLSALKSAINDIAVDTRVSASWQQGYINNSTGGIGSDSKSCVSGYIESNGYEYLVTVGNEYRTKIALYDSSKSFVEIISASSAGNKSLRVAEGNFVRVQVSSDENLSPSAITDSIVKIEERTYTDKTLSKANIPADAKETGDRIATVSSALSGATGCTMIPMVAAHAVYLNSSSVTMADGVPQYSTDASSFACGMIQCTAGDVFDISGVGGSAPRLWGFVSSTGAVLSAAASGASATNLIMTAPTDSAWFIFHTNDGRQSFKGKSIPPQIAENEYVQSHLGKVNLNKSCYIVTSAVGQTLDITPVASVLINSIALPCTEGQEFVISGTPYNNSGIRPYCFADSENKVVERGDITTVINNLRLKAPCTGTVAFNFTNSAPCFVYSQNTDVSAIDVMELRAEMDEITEEVYSTNLYDGEIKEQWYLRKDGVEARDSNLCYMETYIPVKENDWIVAGYGEDTRAQLRFVTAYDNEYNVIAEKGLSGSYKYHTPSGVSFVRVSLYFADVAEDDFRINKSPFLLPYEESTKYTLPKGYGETENILHEPLSTLPDYLVKSLAYRPLGTLSKPYICLVTDDGDEDMITYSIPMVEAKGVPCTWAIMSTSEVFTSADVEENVAAIIDSVENHGCAISQHGGTNWTEFTENDLNAFFEHEKAFLAQYGMVAKSAVIPSHYMSDLICAVAGGKYGVVRSGLNGQNEDGETFEYLVKAYPHYTCGARTNVYGLTSQNLANISQQEAQTVIDYAYQHNGIAIFYWHENALDSTKKQRIEDAIDYALSKGIDFITLDQIATII